MRGGRDEERQKIEESPMIFPRILVNDRPKGRPRVPPWNKMALYEQFGIPLRSQRSSWGFASSPSNFGGGLQNGSCVTFDNVPATSHSAKKQETSSSTGVRLNNLMETNELSPTSNTAPAPSLTASASSLQPQSSHFTRPLKAARISPCRCSQTPKSSPIKNMDSTPVGCRESSTVPPKEVCNRSDRKLQHESVLASSCLSPDDVGKLIGQKNFWKARSALIKQQRVFAVQLFELHRIIKVQNLISRLPHILFEEGCCFRNSRAGVSPAEFLPKTKLNSGNIKENATGRLCHGRNMETLRTPPTLQPKQRPSSAKMQEPENTNKPSMWCFSPTGNQWLVPVVSPSEGLVYKPYTGPGPPNMSVQDPMFCPIKSGLGCGKEYLIEPFGVLLNGNCGGCYSRGSRTLPQRKYE